MKLRCVLPWSSSWCLTYRIIVWLRQEGFSGDHAVRLPARAGCSCPCPVGLWLFRSMETPQPYTTACSSVHPPNKVVFKIKCNFLYFSLCPLSLILSGRFCLHLFYFPHQAFIHVDKMPLTLLSSRLNVSSSLSICSYDRCSSPLIIFVLLCWTHSSMSPFLLYWRAQVGTQHSRCVSFAEGKIKSQPASNAYPNATQNVNVLQGHVAGSWSVIFGVH